MSSSIWTHTRRFSYAAIAAGIVVTAWLLVDCTLTVSELIFSPTYPGLDPALVEMAEIARGAATPELPPGFDRWKLTAPVCAENLPLTDYVPGAATFFIGLFLWFVGRRGEATERHEAVEFERSELDEKRRDVELAKPKPLSAEAEVKAIEVEVDESALGIGSAPPTESVDAHLYEDDGDTLMAFVETRRSADEDEPVEEATEIDGFYCPPGYGDKPVCYVDPEHPNATDDLTGDAAFGNSSRPFATLDGALTHVRQRIVTDIPGAMIRLMPGVYQVTADIPDRVVVVNHRTPAEGDDGARLRWIGGLSLDHSDAVTIVAPPDADYAVRLAPGRNHGLVGCHVLGREGAGQTGIIADGSSAVALLYCVVEGFENGGLKLSHAGSSDAGMAMQVRGCIIRDNVGREGGGVLLEQSVVRFHTCVLSGNRAQSGGAVFARNSSGTSFVKTRFEKNRAQFKPPAVFDPEEVELSAWGQAKGLGGGLALVRSQIELHRSEFVDNGASMAGGAVSVVHSALLLNGDDDTRCRLARNKSRVGGAIFAAGLRSGASDLRIDDTDFAENVARDAGGAVTLVGLAEAKVSDATFDENRVDDDGGCGGAVSLHIGARFLAKRTKFNRNRAAGFGGAVAAINASLKLGEKCACTENVARDGGGGAWVITKVSSAIESLVSAKEIELPFVCDIDRARFRRNATRGLGGGVRIGNTIGRPTPALGVKIDIVRFQSNVTKSDNPAASDLWIEWAGEIVASGLTRPEDKFILK